MVGVAVSAQQKIASCNRDTRGHNYRRCGQMQCSSLEGLIHFTGFVSLS